jgi:hypothetical protein
MSTPDSSASTNKPQPPDLATVLKAIIAVFTSMAAIFGVLNILFPISLLQPVMAIVLGLAVAGVLMRAYSLPWHVPVITWLVVSGIGVIIYLFISRPAMVSGSMVDGTAQPQVGLTVILNDSGGVDHKAITDKDGVFVITNIPEGRYAITVDGKFVRGGNVPSGWSRLFNTLVDIGTAVAVPCTVPPCCVVPPPTPTLLSGGALDWQAYKDKEQSGSSIVVKPGDNAIEISFDLVKDGYVGIAKVLPAKALSGTTGIRFSYQGRGQPNTIEVKLIYKRGTVFSANLRHATVTGGHGWVTREKISYDTFRCWATTGDDPDKCPPTEDLRLDLEKVEIIDFAFSNKPHNPKNPDDTELSDDAPGSGTVTIKDVQAVQ